MPELVEQVVAGQIKEKFGTLRFYYHGGDDYIRGLVSMADAMTSRVCEDCGAPGTARSTKQQPWVLILFALLLVGLALSMFDVYQLQMPTSIQTRLSSQSGQLRAGSLVNTYFKDLLS